MGRQLLHDLRPCPAEETAGHAAYLDDTPMDKLAAALRAGTHALAAAEVRDREALGEVMTCWEELGGFVARDLVGRERFRVREAFTVLMQPEGHDEDGRRKVLRTIADWARGRDGARATLLYEGGGFTVVDWNKRTVAYFERTGPRDRPIAYPVYVVHRRGEAVPLTPRADPPPKAEDRTLHASARGPR